MNMKEILKKGFDSLFIPKSSPRIASDEEAIRDIWIAVGDDIRDAFGIYDETEGREREKTTE